MHDMAGRHANPPQRQTAAAACEANGRQGIAEGGEHGRWGSFGLLVASFKYVGRGVRDTRTRRASNLVLVSLFDSDQGPTFGS